MRIDIYHHMVDEKSIAEKLDSILEFLIDNKSKIKTIMGTLKDIQDANTALTAAVAAEDTVIDSAVVLIKGFGAKLTDLETQLAAAIAANDPAAIQAVADSLTATNADLTAKTQALADAVAAGTPAA
jgi:hypothetical protein